MEDAVSAVRRSFMQAMQSPPIAEEGCREPIVAAFSGGADSAALLTLLASYCAEKNIPLLAVHVHHGIRGEEADRDAEFCRDFCRTRQIPFELCEADVPAFAAARKIGLEEAARQMRYRALESVAAREDARIATAHSADDNLETVLHHMLRGAALEGMCGIPARRGRIIRPLLALSGAQIRDFCRSEGIPFVVDSTNADPIYTRNYIRREIVPALRALTPAPEAAVSRMCSLLREDAAYLRETAEASLGAYADKTEAPTALLASLPEVLCTRACARLYRNFAGEDASLSLPHLRAMTALVRQGQGIACLPGDICARVHRGVLSMHTRDALCRAADPNFHYPLTEGVHSFPAYGFSAIMTRENGVNFPLGENIYKLSTRASFPYATIQGSVYLRFRRPGDRIVSGGMTHSVKKLLSAAGIPPEKRARLPIFCDDAGILWIPGVRVRDAAPDTGERICFAVFSGTDV